MINQSEYKYYVIVGNRNHIIAIDSGWEYKEDARDRIMELADELLTKYSIFAFHRTGTGAKHLGLDPNIDKNWLQQRYQLFADVRP